MSEAQKCPQCGNALPADSAQGLCPACLLKRGLEENTLGQTVIAASMRWTPPPPEQLRQRFPGLEILELIGRGGMGAVYKAHQIALDRTVALKILPPEIGRDPDFSARFTREAQAMAKLSHPNIVAIYDFGRKDPINGGEELYFFIMEYVDGLSLRQLLNTGNVAAREALAIVPQICDALQYAHDHGIVHRDIKPENILISKRGQVKIADFGLAKLTGRPGDVTATGSEKILGTPHYMAPEQTERPQQVDHRADIFALGVVFYQMLTGELPIGKFSLPSRKVLIDVRLDDVVLKALEKEPDRRYQQANEVKTEVQTIREHPAPARAATPPRPTAPEVLNQPWNQVYGQVAPAAIPHRPPVHRGQFWLPIIIAYQSRRWLNFPAIGRYFLIALLILFSAVIFREATIVIMMAFLFWTLIQVVRQAWLLPIERLYTLDITSSGTAPIQAHYHPPHPQPPLTVMPPSPRPPKPLITFGSAVALLFAFAGMGIALSSVVFIEPAIISRQELAGIAALILICVITSIALALIWFNRAGIVAILLAFLTVVLSVVGAGWFAWQADRAHVYPWSLARPLVATRPSGVLTPIERDRARDAIERDLQATLADRLRFSSVDYDGISISLARDARSATVDLKNPRHAAGEPNAGSPVHGSFRIENTGMRSWQITGQDDFSDIDIAALAGPDVDVSSLVLPNTTDDMLAIQTAQEAAAKDLERVVMEYFKRLHFVLGKISYQLNPDGRTVILYIRNFRGQDPASPRPDFQDYSIHDLTGTFTAVPLTEDTWQITGNGNLAGLHWVTRPGEVHRLLTVPVPADSTTLPAAIVAPLQEVSPLTVQESQPTTTQPALPTEPQAQAIPANIF